MSSLDRFRRQLLRRQLLGGALSGLGTAALATLAGPVARAAVRSGKVDAAQAPHFAPRARRAIYLFQSGGPSHIDLWDHKPHWDRLHGQPIPPSVWGPSGSRG